MQLEWVETSTKKPRMKSVGKTANIHETRVETKALEIRESLISLIRYSGLNEQVALNYSFFVVH